MPATEIMTTILVPQGAEYQAVCRGLRGITSPPLVLPVPASPAPLVRHLQQLDQAGQFAERSPLWLIGLCGSLTPRYGIGDRVLYRECVTADQPPLACDAALTQALEGFLTPNLPLVTGLMSDRVIASAAEKQFLASTADVVDMEGYAALAFFRERGMAIAMVRVVSDDCQHDLPDLSAAFDADGSLQPLPLALGMLARPIAATRLIRGSLKGLKALQHLTTELCAKGSYR